MIAELSDYCLENFATEHTRRLFYGALAESERRPAGIEPERLGQKDQPFAVIARPFVQPLSLFADDSKIVGHARKFSVAGEKTAEGVRLIAHQADTEPSFRIAALRLFGKARRLLLFNGALKIGAHRTAREYRLLFRHDLFSSLR